MRRSCTRFCKQNFHVFSSFFPHWIELQQAANLWCYNYRNCITISANSWLDVGGNDPWKLARDDSITINSAGFGSCICCYLLIALHVCHIKIGKKIPVGRFTVHRRWIGISSLFLLCKFKMITWRRQ